MENYEMKNFYEFLQLLNEALPQQNPQNELNELLEMMPNLKGRPLNQLVFYVNKLSEIVKRIQLHSQGGGHQQPAQLPPALQAAANTEIQQQMAARYKGPFRRPAA